MDWLSFCLTSLTQIGEAKKIHEICDWNTLILSQIEIFCLEQIAKEVIIFEITSKSSSPSSSSSPCFSLSAFCFFFFFFFFFSNIVLKKLWKIQKIDVFSKIFCFDFYLRLLFSVDTLFLFSLSAFSFASSTFSSSFSLKQE